MFLYVAVVLAIIVLAVLCDIRRPKNYPKGPNWLPVVGNYVYFRKRLSVLGFHHLVWQELNEKYGNIVGTRLGRNLIVTVFGPDVVNEVLTREEFEGRPDGFFFRFRTFGKRLGVVFSDGNFWQKQRKFSVQHLRNFGFGKREMNLKIEEEAHDLIRELKNSCGSGVQMQHVFDISVLNVLWTMLAGERFALDDVKLITLVKIIHDAFKLIDMSGGLLNQMPFLRYLAPDACGYTQTVEILQKLFNFLQETIEEHKNTICTSNCRDFIDAFIHRMSPDSNDSETFTGEQLYSVCLDLFMAGTETTSNTLSFSILYMLKYPQVQKRVQNEIDEIVGGNRSPTLHDRMNLPYTEAVLMEVQRITNIPPLGIAHRAMRDTVLQGFNIPKGTIVLTSLYSVHMNSEFWKDPHEFRPERFLNSDGKVQIPEKHFIPFGLGKRRCLGESLAKASYFIFFTSTLYSFDIEEDPCCPDPELVGCDGITLSPKPFSVLLKPRQV